ncbi:MAG: 50S ribosomal protein L19 [candidate division Zixibacteria bacterium]|nr:50S ribosomal protein L19 [candidate division Zixibacteria bacterium]
MKRIDHIEKSYMRGDHPQFGSGDTLRIHVKIREGDKERIQVFQGTVISRRGGGTGETFTVRKMSGGIGVERVFPLHSPNIDKIEKLRSGSVRRAKLYYLRKLTGKSARIKEQLSDKLSKKAEEPAQPVEPETKPEEKPVEAVAEEPKAEAKVEEVPAEKPEADAKSEEKSE